MSEAACGPSNALQQFKQQTQHDRTLQQDRLTSRQHPGQGFRSADPNAGLLDPEFEAFQAGLPPPAFQSFQPHQHAPQPFQQSFQEPAQSSSAWANDFQRMSLSSPPPMQQQHHAGPSTSNWAQDFRSNVAQSAPRAQNSSPSPFAFQQRARYGMGGYQSSFAQPAFSPAMQTKGKEPATEQFDEAAFERAFDMAKEDMVMESVPDSTLEDAQVGQEAQTISAEKVEESHQINQDDIQEDIMESTLALDTDQHMLPEGMIREEQHETQESTRNDDDALAATAQELLEKVENNQSEKFRNSQFLGLMRKLRDREVKVEGDKMVETTTTASTSTADLPLNTTSAPRFNNSEQIPRSEQDLDAHRYADPGTDGSDVVNLLSEPGLPGGEPSDPASLAPETDASNLNMSDDMERRRLADMWRSMLPSESSPRGLDPRTHSPEAEESGFASPAFTM
ncbi:hypothetical protein Q7P37_001074 [Cladosporium fusiforme]